MDRIYYRHLRSSLGVTKRWSLFYKTYRAGVSSGGTADGEVDAETAHGLQVVIGATRCGRVVSHDEPPPAHDLTVHVDGEYA
jgi:hypothetical protein